MNDDKPSEYFNHILENTELMEEYPLAMLSDLVDTEQSPEHHPEGNVWNHTMLVVDNAAEKKGESRNPRVFMWAALLHDLGKAPTTCIRNGRITAYSHDIEGEKLAKAFLKEYIEDEKLIREVSKLVRWHMQTLFVVKNMPFADIDAMAEQTSIDEVALLSLCDRLGRGEIDDHKEKEERNNVDIFLRKSKEYLNKRRL
jgi:putative nucleotidyltransferase with HDIG domain